LHIDHSYNQDPVKAQLSISSPNYSEKGVSNTMISLFLKAKKSIKLVSPYFLPTESTINALKIAAQNGVEVKVLLPGKRDNKDFILPMNRSQYRQLFETGIKVYEYNGFIHSKYIIVDNKLVYATSANFDFRSMIINFENGILIDAPEVCQQMLSIFEDDISNSQIVTAEDVAKHNNLRTKIRLALLNLYKPLL
jgi:cardiolipin synthase